MPCHNGVNMRKYLKVCKQIPPDLDARSAFLGEFNASHAKEAGCSLQELQALASGELSALRLINKWNSTCCNYNLPYWYILTRGD